MPDGTAKTIDQLPEKKTLLEGDMAVFDDGAQTYRVLWSEILRQAGGIKEVNDGSEGSITITLNSGKAFTIRTNDPTKQPLLVWDQEPKAGSANPVTSSGIYSALQTLEKTGTGLDQRISENARAISEEVNRAQAAERVNAEAIATLNSSAATQGSVANQVAGAIAELVASAPENLNTLQEIAAWIEGHASSAAEMNREIQDNATAIQKLEALGLYVDDEGDICQK